MNDVMNASTAGTSWMQVAGAAVLAQHLVDLARTRRSDGSSSVSIHGPSGQKVSWPLPRVHCASFFCCSRAVTSFAAV
jgi:hypothetical protein